MGCAVEKKVPEVRCLFFSFFIIAEKGMDATTFYEFSPKNCNVMLLIRKEIYIFRGNKWMIV